MSIKFQKWKHFFLDVPYLAESLDEQELPPTAALPDEPASQSTLSVAGIVQRPWRIEVFIKKISQNQPFKFIGGGSHTLSMDELPKFLELQKLVLNNKLTVQAVRDILGDGTPVVKLKLATGLGTANYVKLTELSKTGEFGGKGSTVHLNKQRIALNNNKPINLVLQDSEGKDIFYITNVSEVVEAVTPAGQKEPKADFIIIGDKETFVSHKDGTSPRGFLQWSGTTFSAGAAIYNHREVREFAQKLKENSDLTQKVNIGNQVYYMMRQKSPAISTIKSPELKMMAVFGQDYSIEQPSGLNNVDLVCQGNFSLTDYQDPDYPGTYVLTAHHIMERTSFNGVFPSGYEPTLSAKYNGGRSNLGILKARISIYPKGGMAEKSIDLTNVPVVNQIN
jgi:hypothetical protein